MHCAYSDSGNSINVRFPDGEEKNFSILEFTELIGEEYLPEREPGVGDVINYDAIRSVESVQQADDIKRYYDSIRRFLRPSRCTMRTIRANAQNVNYWARTVGLEELTVAETEKLIKHLFNKSFLQKMRYRVRKYSKAGELISVKDMVMQFDQDIFY